MLFDRAFEAARDMLEQIIGNFPNTRHSANAHHKLREVEQAQFTTFVPATNFPLGAEPILIQQARIKLMDKATALELVMPKGQLLTMNLTEDMIAQLRLLLQTIAQRAQWGRPGQGGGARHAARSRAPLHAAAAGHAHGQPGRGDAARHVHAGHAQHREQPVEARLARGGAVGRGASRLIRFPAAFAAGDGG